MTLSAPASEIVAGTARSYALVGFIFYILSACGWIIGIFALLFSAPLWWEQIPEWIQAIIIIPTGIFGALSIGFTVWAWITLKNIETGRYSEARTASLVLGVFGLFLAWLIGGIFFLLAYSKLGKISQSSTRR